ncbi:MAG: hypothetical protein ACT4O1_12550 [Gemmatimonadota bacterium]
MSLFHELRRRKVVRTTVAYLAAGFVTAQGVQLLVDGLDLPSWILKAVLIVLLAALPLVIGLAWAFDITPDGVERTGNEPAQSRIALPWRRIALPATASVLILLASLAFLSLDEAPAPLNHNLVSVMPFHVSGDQQIAYLRDGMVDLLTAKLTGEGGPRAVDPRVVMNAVRQQVEGRDISDEDAREIARTIGAGQVLVGSVVGTPEQFTIQAKLLRVPGGRMIAQSEESATSATLLPAIDRLTAKLLSLQAGEGLQRLDVLTTTSLPALRAYLDAQAAYRRGQFGTASEQFGHALDLDSTFALAALGQRLSSGWGEGPIVDFAKINRIMRNNRDRLSPVDRALVAASIGEPNTPHSLAARIAAHEAVAEMAPDRADAWFLLADVMVHWGTVADRDGLTRAGAMFARVLELDSTYTPALLHLIDKAMYEGDIAEVRRLEEIRKLRNPDESGGRYQRPLRIRALGDSTAIKADRAALDTMDNAGLLGLSLAGLFLGEVDDALRAIEQMSRNAATDRERADAYEVAGGMYSVYGMPSKSAAALDKLADSSTDPIDAYNFQLLYAVYANGDTASARYADRAMDARLKTASPLQRVRGLCAREQWRLWNGQRDSYSATAAELSRVPPDSAFVKLEADVCMQVLVTIDAMSQPKTLSKHVRMLDAIMRDGPQIYYVFRNAANVVVARAAERAGDRRLAYRAMSRFPLDPHQYWFSGTMRREMARLAALSGDTARAIQEYTRYLNSQLRAEPGLKLENDAARAHLAQLTGERR